MSNLKQGWGWPFNSRRAHFFEEGEIISICGKMMFAGERTDNNHDSQDNCAECKRKRLKAIEKGKILITEEKP